jgi:hypothetical protein
MNRVVFENKLEIVVFLPDGRLVQTHKTTFVKRHSLNTWPDFESAKKAFELGSVRWPQTED